jgi:hypothetical protein
MKLLFLVGAAFASNPTPARSVCPMLNTLANHYHLPYNGTSFNLSAATKVFDEVLNIDSTVAAVLFNGAIARGLNSTSDRSSISLTSINAPGFSEHDASLVRVDYALARSEKEFLDANLSLVIDLLGTAADKKCITLSEISRFRKSRVMDSAQRNPKFIYNQDIAIRAAGESALIFLVFGKDGCIPLDVAWNLFARERFHKAFVRPVERITFARFEATLRQALVLAQ